MKSTLFTALLIGILGGIGFAQNLDKAKLDNYFNTLETNKFMGNADKNIKFISY